ncbi:MAG TPA: DNA topoisomerase IB [Acidimicrobiia bacterium]|nr:DNA topoisomerase IB [Acidimicrobiia bacterium]
MTERTASLELAASAGLRYTSDEEPGHRRIRRGKGFSYIDENGDPLDDDSRAWAESLVIPPAWTDVWINPARDGHILATGYDDAGRKQYIYHPDWEEARDEVKFERMESFARRLPRIRKRVASELARPGLDREKVVALTVAVLDRTLIRVGTQRYVETNESYGLTTLTPDHAEVEGRRVVFSFSGKGGAEHEVALRDSRLASLISKCQDLGGQTLFAYEVDDGVGTVGSADVNRYLSDTAGEGFSAKDFRTWGASAVVTGELAIVTHDDPDKSFLQAVDVAAERLGNTRDVCRASYLHPVVRDAFEDGRLRDAWMRSRRGRWMSRPESAFKRLLSV